MPFLIPIAIVVGLGAAGAAVYAATREPHLSASDVGLKLGTATSGTVGTVAAAAMPAHAVQGKAVDIPIPSRVSKQTAAEKLALFREQWVPVYLHYDGCKDWFWGFNVLQIASDAAAYGGAGVVKSIIAWILDYTALGGVTDLLNFKFRFKLPKYSISEKDKDGAWRVTASQRKRLSEWMPRGDVPPVPLPAVSGWTAAWLNKKVGGVYAGEDDRMLTVIRPRKGTVYAGEKLWEWAWMTDTTAIRALLRHDKINLSTIAKVQCGKGKWWLTLRSYVDDIYK